MTVKKAGNVVAGGFIVISADGTSRTFILMTSDPSGKKVPFIASLRQAVVAREAIRLSTQTQREE